MVARGPCVDGARGRMEGYGRIAIAGGLAHGGASWCTRLCLLSLSRVGSDKGSSSARSDVARRDEESSWVAMDDSGDGVGGVYECGLW
jgi:hypothetical protein